MEYSLLLVTLQAVDTNRYVKDLEFLSDVTRETLSSLQLGPLLKRLVKLMRERFGYHYAAVALVNGDWVEFRMGSGGGLDKVFGKEDSRRSWRLEIGRGLVGKVVEQGRSKLVNDVASDDEYLMLGFLASTRSELTVPLIHQDEVLGVLDVQSDQVDAFTDNDLKLLEIVAALVSPPVHFAQIHERWRRRMRYLHLLGEISHLVMSTLTERNVIEVACEAILEALDVSFVGIGLKNRAGTQLIHAGHATNLELLVDGDPSTKVGEGVVGRVAASGESIRLDDVDDIPDFIHIVPGMRSALCLPIRIRDRIIGALDIEHSKASHFTNEDQRHMENLAAYLAQALENAELFEKQRRRWQQLLVINETARIATEPLELEQILEQVVREVHDRFGYYAVAVMLKEEDEVILKALKCVAELDQEIGHTQPVGAGVSGRVVQNGQLILHGNRDQFDAASALRDDIQSILSVPLRAQSGVIGVIEVQNLECDAFDSEDQLVMETLAKSVAGAIANADAIQRAEQVREDLNRMIVHDLRNPVQAMLLTLQEVEHASRGNLDDRVVDSVKEGITCTEDILGMVNSLLDVKRFEAGKANLRLSPAVLNDHIRATIRRFAPIARSKGIQVTSVLSQDVPVVRMDHDLIDRTLANLVGNALKFTPKGAQVTARTELVTEEVDGRPPPPYVLVEMQDTGEGIPPQYHDKIFEKFGQVESRKAGLKMSTGLGLALCRYVVEAHGGKIWVESKPERGSTFLFTLPV